MTALDVARLTKVLELHRELAHEDDIDVVLRRIASEATTILGAERGTLFVADPDRNELWSRVLVNTQLSEIRLPLDGTSLAAAVAREGRPLRIDDAYDDPRFDPSVDARSGLRTRSLLVLPIEARDGRRIGVLQVINSEGGAFTEAHELLGSALAAAASVALEYVALHAELAAERLRVVHVAEETRHRLARDLHDGVAQTLANAAIGIEIAERYARQDVGAALTELAGLRARLIASQKDLRDILFALRPVILEEGGLGPAIRALAERVDGTNGSRVAAREVTSQRRLRPEVEAGAFTVLREAVNNAVKTGRAKTVQVDVQDGAGTVEALVEDDGVGFDVASTLARYSSSGSLGLLQMRESARLIGARLSIDSSVGHGTRIRLRIPVEARVE